mmetsp:Transcript_75465/g.166725  ORF Transcript_75465/g.166725 Transcript_75465/m.166725 type:complete len:219 (-) Transcript_75465:3-659(-)
MKFQVHMCHSAAFQQAIRREEASGLRQHLHGRFRQRFTSLVVTAAAPEASGIIGPTLHKVGGHVQNIQLQSKTSRHQALGLLAEEIPQRRAEGLKNLRQLLMCQQRHTFWRFQVANHVHCRASGPVAVTKELAVALDRRGPEAPPLLPRTAMRVQEEGRHRAAGTAIHQAIEVHIFGPAQLVLLFSDLHVKELTQQMEETLQNCVQREELPDVLLPES